MKHLTPIELLAERIEEYQKALHKSMISAQYGIISEELNLIHRNNLEPKIKEYQEAINKLK